VQRRDYDAMRAGLIAGYRAGVEPWRSNPAQFGIRRDAWEENVAAVGAMIKTRASSFDYAKWRAEIAEAVK
jgi:hypothetical protein